MGCASAAEVNNVSDIESSHDYSDILSSDMGLDNELSSKNTADEKISVNNENVSILSKSTDGVVGVSASVKTKKASFEVITPTVINRNYFQVKLLDKNGTALAKKVVKLEFNGKAYNKTTDANGIAKLKLNGNKGYHSIKYSFSEDGYATITKKSKILIVPTGVSKISGSNFEAYVGFKCGFIITLTVDGVKLANKKVRFNFNGKNYYRTTNDNGKTKLSIVNVSKGSYTIKYYFEGENNISSSSGKSVITVKKGIPTKITKVSSVYFLHRTTAPFKVKVLDKMGNPAKGKVIFSIIGKKFTRNINSKGIATMNIWIRAGSYKMTYKYSPASKIYKKSSGSTTLKVKTNKKCVNNGYWIFGYDMKRVNLAKLAKGGTKHIFLNYYAIKTHGRTAVEKFMKNAKSKGIKVHIWMQICYNGDWISPVKNGKYKYSFFKSKINEAKKYASLKWVSGIHLDYIRFPGDAYNHANGVKAINYFVKKLCNAVHKINPKLIVSAALMPEPDSLKYYYGQDVKTLSKYLDVLIPMVYKGNYGAGTSWIKTTTSKFVKMSSGAQVWTGIQGYRSDGDVSLLSASELLKDAQSAAKGGATGVISFRWGVSKLINFRAI